MNRFRSLLTALVVAFAAAVSAHAADPVVSWSPNTISPDEPWYGTVILDAKQAVSGSDEVPAALESVTNEIDKLFSRFKNSCLADGSDFEEVTQTTTRIQVEGLAKTPVSVSATCTVMCTQKSSPTPTASAIQSSTMPTFTSSPLP